MKSVPAGQTKTLLFLQIGSCKLPPPLLTAFKVAYRVQIRRKTFFQKFLHSFIKNDIIYFYLPFINKKPIILSLFEMVTLNFTMFVLTISTCSLKVMPLENRFFKARFSLNPILITKQTKTYL